MIEKCAYAYSSIGISLVVIFMFFQYNSETTVRKEKHWNLFKWKSELFQITSLPKPVARYITYLFLILFVHFPCFK